MKEMLLSVKQFCYPNCGCCFHHCVGKIKGVYHAHTNVVNMTALVEYDENIYPNPDELIKKIKKLGFDVEPNQE